MPALIQVQEDQRTWSRPRPPSHLQFHHTCSGGSSVHPPNHGVPNPFPRNKSFLKACRWAGALQKGACIRVFMKDGIMSPSNPPDGAWLSLKTKCDMLFSAIKPETTAWGMAIVFRYYWGLWTIASLFSRNKLIHCVTQVISPHISVSSTSNASEGKKAFLKSKHFFSCLHYK